MNTYFEIQWICICKWLLRPDLSPLTHCIEMLYFSMSLWVYPSAHARNNNVIFTQNHAATPFWRNNNFIIASYARWWIRHEVETLSALITKPLKRELSIALGFPSQRDKGPVRPSLTFSLKLTCKRCCTNSRMSVTGDTMAPIVYHCDVIMSAMASQITGLAIVWSTLCLGADQEQHQSSPSLAFVRGIHR